ncbi:hypothetical protein H8K32_11310 [Undibacterium jejuense]|uniref:Uncharacterized protein n=1 Tax=Undibacterium jejuense TaxID=1344949 RepID=A0A923KQB8_9BURK|nr:hypothetical protein [Undibacterium jejuense]MBC3862691.1 hypothetical protein [Undibacterium jejuense]
MITPQEQINTDSTGWSLGVYSLPTEPIPKQRRVKVSTYTKLYEHIRQGYGTGHGKNYKPWLTLTRKNPSPTSNQVVSYMPPLERTAHYFSRGEYHTALFLLWLGVLDLREQFPIWPIAHPHPLDGASARISTKLKWSRGLLSIAREADIKHGHEVGSKRPYVASIDLVATTPFGDNFALSFFSSKPIHEPTAKVKWRTLERLELERRYAREVCANYFVSSSALIPLRVASQLEWWIDCSTLHFCPELLKLASKFSDFVNSSLTLSISEAVISASTEFSIPIDHGWSLFRHCAWKQLIDIDPSMQILTSFPVRGGGRALRTKIQQQLFRESWL